MIKVLGDSHALYCFRNMAGVFAWPLGPVTLKRVGYREDTIVADNIRRIGAAPDDLFLFLFGEIDVRAHIKPWYERRKDRTTLDAILGDWVRRYAEAISLLDLNGARRGIVSVLPPAKSTRFKDKRYPVAGTDAERADYTRRLNAALAGEAAGWTWPFVDIHGIFADAAGMLPVSRSDRSIHVKDNRPIARLLAEMGLL